MRSKRTRKRKMRRKRRRRIRRRRNLPPKGVSMRGCVSGFSTSVKMSRCSWKHLGGGGRGRGRRGRRRGGVEWSWGPHHSSPPCNNGCNYG